MSLLIANNRARIILTLICFKAMAVVQIKLLGRHCTERSSVKQYPQFISFAAIRGQIEWVRVHLHFSDNNVVKGI